MWGFGWRLDGMSGLNRRDELIVELNEALHRWRTDAQ
jgi:hypothetical protein